MLVSSLILTMNEEINLPGCLDSLSWCDDVVVFDSFSTDRTVEIAESRGARVFQHRFVNYGAQREAARTLVSCKHPWVLAVDADERVEPALAKEVCSVTAENGREHAAYRVRRKDHFMGRWIPHATLYPTWFIRLYRNDCIYYSERSVHEHPEVNGTLGVLKGHLLHYSFNKGFVDWLRKHERYASLEAEEALRSLSEGALHWKVPEFGDPTERRRFLKALSYPLHVFYSHGCDGRGSRRGLLLSFVIIRISDCPEDEGPPRRCLRGDLSFLSIPRQCPSVRNFSGSGDLYRLGRNVRARIFHTSLHR